jgi:RNA polymerase sigma-70 factor, ECF subfamily
MYVVLLHVTFLRNSKKIRHILMSLVTVALWGKRVDHDQKAPPEIALDPTHAFRCAYEANVDIIYRFIYSKVGNREEAEDLTAQVFTKAIYLVDWQRDMTEIRHWLMQVARTTIADHWRAHYRLRTTSLNGLLAGGWEGPAASNGTVSYEDMSIPVKDILDSLPPRYREVLHYRFLLGYSIRDTAQQMNITEANAKILQLRALRRAAEIHGKHLTEIGVPTHEQP